MTAKFDARGRHRRWRRHQQHHGDTFSWTAFTMAVNHAAAVLARLRYAMTTPRPHRLNTNGRPLLDHGKKPR